MGGKQWNEGHSGERNHDTLEQGDIPDEQETEQPQDAGSLSLAGIHPWEPKQDEHGPDKPDDAAYQRRRAGQCCGVIAVEEGLNKVVDDRKCASNEQSYSAQAV